ncbi:hypothetical protein [Streptomyces sp. NPDC056401]|uniref:hypothetical protein n=1 Tax=Streptomyces sp. NPDC056401 TaxID=3345809 RepID=UPI0035D962D2
MPDRVRYDFPAPTYRVLFYLTSRQNAAEPGIVVSGVQTYIAKTLGMGTPSVSKALRELRNAGVIRPIIPGMWQIHPDYMFGGYRSEEDNVVALPFAA